MIKKMSLFGLIGLFVGIFTLSSCSSDSDSLDTDNLKTNIVGLWETHHISGYDYDDDNNSDEDLIIPIDSDITGSDRDRILFKGDGTYKKYFYLTSSDSWFSNSFAGGKYEVSGNRIYIYDTKGNIEDTYTVTSLKNNTLVVEFPLDEGSKYINRLTLKKVE